VALAPAIYVEESGAVRLLTTIAPLDFGDVERGSFSMRHIILENQTYQRLNPGTIGVFGESFRLGGVNDASMAAGETRIMTLFFSPQRSGIHTGGLGIGQRLLPVRAAGVETLPRASMVFDRTTAQSGSQIRLTVRLEDQARARGAGRVQLMFRPAVGISANDSAIVFSLTGTQDAPFTVNEGDTAGHFSAQPYIDFQTGTTAGVIVCRLEMGK
jgi:hypothetical protein